MTDILAVHPGASFSTHDVFVGHVTALRKMGINVVTYHLDYRIGESGALLRRMWERQKRVGGPLAALRPTAADVQYHAGVWLLENYARLQPRWVVFWSAMYAHPNLILLLKNLGARIAIVFSESPYDDALQARIAPFAEVCFTNERASVAVLRAANPNTHYLSHAFDPERHHPAIPVPDDTPAHDVVFVGTGFQERLDFLGAVDWTGIDLGLYGSWTLLPPRHPLRPFVRSEEIDNHEAVALYRRAKIGINLFRSSKGFGVGAPKIAAGDAESLNPRLLELAACGVFTLSDWRPEVQEVFCSAVPTFTTPQELGALVRTWLGNDGARAAVARLLPGQVYDWTFDATARRLVAHLGGAVRVNLVLPTDPRSVEELPDGTGSGAAASGTLKGSWGVP